MIGGFSQKYTPVGLTNDIMAEESTSIVRCTLYKKGESKIDGPD